MQCPRCPNEVPEGSKFCNSCGARLDAACPQCGRGNPPGSRFCTECGQALVAAASPAAISTLATPESYTPKHLAERILTSRAALEGERKQVTVLFADLKGSMELLADRDAEEARRVLDPVLERMMDAVHRYEGTVNQVMGDGIMALFGAPLAHEDHAVRACYAALRMQEAVGQYADDIWRSQNVRVQIRVGLNSGEVVVRSIGSDLRMDYTAVGQTTHLAARMEQLAAPGSILLAPDALRLAEGYVQVKPLGQVQVKGLGEPVEVYELVGAGLARSRLQAATARGLTRFVGRDAELATLRRTLELAGTGHGQIVALVGEPGVGKSRLVWEFTHSHRTQGWLVLEGGSLSYGKATSYLPVIELLKGYCGIETRDDPRCVREKVAGKLLMLDRTLEPLLPALLALLDLPMDDPTWEALDPRQRQQYTLDACKRLLLRESREQPLLLVFEDLHWIDAETQALLDSMVDSLPAARVLLLVNYRPEYEHAWHRKTYYQQLRLDPLVTASARELLGALLGDDRGLDPLKAILVERTEGNPFFLEESVRALVELGTLVGERGSYRLARTLHTTQVPATVQAVLAARIDRLTPDDKRLLQSAAVIGKDVPYALLRAIAELPEEALRQALARLQAAELLYETSLFPDLEYTFKHALTHEVTYGSLLQERRRALHAGILAALESLYPDRQAEQVERLAHHALRGEVWENAAVYLRQAGTKAAGHSAYQEAVGYYEQALGALGNVPESSEMRGQAIDLRIQMYLVLLYLGEFGRILTYLRDAESLALAADDRPRLGRVSAFLSAYYWNAGDYGQAIEAGQRALAIAHEFGNLSLQVQTSLYLGQAYYWSGEFRRAIEVLSESVVSVQADLRSKRFGLPFLPTAISLSWLAVAFAELGEFAEGIPRGEEAVRIAEAADNPFSLAATCWSIGQLYLVKGDLAKAIALGERGLAVCRTSHIPLLFPVTALGLGHAYVLAGRSDEGVLLLEEGLKQNTSMGRKTGYSLGNAFLSEAKLLSGHRGEAVDLARRSLDIARQLNERGNEAWVLRLLARIAAESDPPEVEQAVRYYQQAFDMAEELGMRPLVAHCHLGLGTLYQRVSRAEQAQADLAAAAELYGAMEMISWLTQAEAALAQLAR